MQRGARNTRRFVKQVAFLEEPAIVERLEWLARFRGHSVASEVRWAIREHLRMYPAEETRRAVGA